MPSPDSEITRVPCPRCDGKGSREEQRWVGSAHFLNGEKECFVCVGLGSTTVDVLRVWSNFGRCLDKPTGWDRIIASLARAE